MTALRALILLLLVAGCTVPTEDRCFAEATREVSTVFTLIAEAEQAAARGYREVDDTWIDIDVSDCYATLSPRSICTTQYDTPRSRPVAVDPATERRIAQDLRSRVPALKAEARRAYDACLISERVR
jgi:hypothetical protein